MDIDAKLRPLYLIQILKERTDEDNYLTTTQLCDILKKKYNTSIANVNSSQPNNIPEITSAKRSLEITSANALPGY